MKFSFHNKKGLEDEMVIYLTLMVALVVFLFIYIAQVKDTSNRSVDVTSCRTSVIRNARLHIEGITFPTTLNCPATRVDVAAGDSDDVANEKIANAMYDCWYKFGEGKLDLFKDEGTFCSVCSFIDVKKDKISKLPEYLVNHEIPDSSGKDYASYLTGYSTSRAKEILGAVRSDTSGAMLGQKMNAELPGNTDYAALFIYSKGQDNLKRVLNHLTLSNQESKVGIAMGGIVGGSAGAAAGSAVAAGWVGLAALGVVSGPPGWIVLGGATVIGAVIGAASGGVDGWVTSYFGSPKVPEWAAFTAIREWSGTDTQGSLSGFGCEYFPTKLE